MPGRAAAGQGIKVMFRQGYRGAASRLLLGLPVCAGQARRGLYSDCAAGGEGTRWRAESVLKGLAEGDCGAGAVGEDAPFWSLLSSGLSPEEGRVEDYQGFWAE